MQKKEILIVSTIFIIVLLGVYFLSSMTGKIISSAGDEFSNIETPHWTHIPVTYSIDNKECESQTENIQKAFNTLEKETNSAVSFQQVQNNPDIEITCFVLEDCYEEKTEKKWFWIITTEAICSHKSGKAQITKLRGNKIINAKIELINIEEEKQGKKPGQNNCSENIIHEILHVFDYSHKQDNNSIMYPDKPADSACNEKIDDDIIEDLIAKYKK
jgi:ssRNA-specific RNase YbeY (16S rRNA maturation enzyme)